MRKTTYSIWSIVILILSGVAGCTAETMKLGLVPAQYWALGGIAAIIIFGMGLYSEDKLGG